MRGDATYGSLPAGAFYGLERPLRTLALDDVTLEVTLMSTRVGVFRAFASAAAPFDIVVPFSVTIGAVYNLDFQTVTTVTIPAGAMVSNEIHPAQQGTRVDVGTLPTPPRGHSGYRLSKATTGLPLDPYGYTGLILGRPKLSLFLWSRTVREGGSAGLTAHLSRVATEDVELRVWALPDSQRESLSDVSLSADPVLTITAGTTSSTGTVTIATVDNSVFAGDKLFDVGAAVTAGSAVVPGRVQLRIREDDPVPVVSLALSAPTIAEDGGSVRVTAKLDAALTGEIGVRVSVQAFAPATDHDYRITGDTELVIPKGRTESTRSVTITAVDDDAFSGDRKLLVHGKLTPKGIVFAIC